MKYSIEDLRKAGLPDNEADLKKTSARYPWFFTARAATESGDGKYDVPMSLHLMFHPTPLPMLRHVYAEDFYNKEVNEAMPVPDNVGNTEADDIIEKFLRSGEYRIVPDENTPEADVAQESGLLELPDDMMTEELAEIYMKQGLTEQAEAVYRKLGK